jgi:hypothetical protein
MKPLVYFPAHPLRRLEIVRIEDATLTKFGINPGEDAVVARDEFYPGDFHALECGSRVSVYRMCERPPNLIGRVIPPHFREPHRLNPIPPGGVHFETDAAGNLVEVDGDLIERCWGIPAKSCLGYGFIQNVAPELRGRFAYEWSAALEAGGDCSITTVTLRKDGSKVPLVVSASPHIRNMSRRFNGWSGVTQAKEIIKAA